jgi:hypothetical protein
MLGQTGQGPDQDFVILVRPVGAHREDELLGQPVTIPGGGHRAGGDGAERPDVDPVGDQGGMRGGGIVLTDLGQAGPGRRRSRGCPPEHGPGRQLQPGLAVPAAREAHVTLDRAVMDGHHQRARADERGEGRIRDVQHGRADRADQPGEFPAALHRAQRDVGADHLGMGRQFRQREELGPVRVDEHPQGQAIVGLPHVRGQLHHRAGDPMRARQPVHPCVEEDRTTTASHIPAPLLIWTPPGAGLGRTAARTRQPPLPAGKLLCMHR